MGALSQPVSQGIKFAHNTTRKNALIASKVNVICMHKAKHLSERCQYETAPLREPAFID